MARLFHLLGDYLVAMRSRWMPEWMVGRMVSARFRTLSGLRQKIK